MKVFIIFCTFFICYTSGVAVRKFYTSSDGSQYFIEPEKKFNWYESWNECMRKNMSLIAIDTFEKHLQIDEILKKHFATTPAFWLGGHDNAIDLRYEWISTGEIFTFTNWGPGQPGRSNNNEHCILMWHDFNWHDYPCTNKLGFICEENRYVKQMELLQKEQQQKSDATTKFKNILMYINALP